MLCPSLAAVEALLELKLQLTGWEALLARHGINLTGWQPHQAASLCRWSFVTCDARGRLSYL